MLLLAAGSSAADDPGDCQEAISAEQAQLLADHLREISDADACLLTGITTDRTVARAYWSSQGEPLDPVRFESVLCAEQPTTAGSRMAVTIPAAVATRCPQIAEGIVRMVQTDDGVPLLQPIATNGPRGERLAPQLARGWRLLLFVLTAGLLWLLLRRRLDTTSAVALAACGGALVAGLVAYLTVRVHATYMVAFELGSVASVLQPERPLPSLPGSFLAQNFRPMLPWLVDILPRALVTSAVGWALLMLAFHLVNGALLGVLAAKLGAPRRWAIAGAMLFVANPTTHEFFSHCYAVEFGLLMGQLGLVIGYIGRRHAATWRAWLLWFAVEAIAVVVGIGSKESFVIYPALLAALELLWFFEHGIAGWRAHLGAVARRAAPHLLLFPFTLWSALPAVFDNELHDFPMSFAPTTLFSQFSALAGANTLPDLANAVAPWLAGGLVLIAMAVAVLWERPRSHAFWFGLAFFWVVFSPVLPMTGRPIPAYVYQPWAGLVLLWVGLLATTRRRPVKLLGLLWVLYLALSLPHLTDWRAEGMALQRVAELSEKLDRQVCGESPVRWQVPDQVWRPMLEGWPGVESGEPFSTLEETFTWWLRLRCENQEARAILTESQNGPAPPPDSPD